MAAKTHGHGKTRQEKKGGRRWEGAKKQKKIKRKSSEIRFNNRHTRAHIGHLHTLRYV